MAPDSRSRRPRRLIGVSLIAAGFLLLGSGSLAEATTWDDRLAVELVTGVLIVCTAVGILLLALGVVIVSSHET